MAETDESIDCKILSVMASEPSGKNFAIASANCCCCETAWNSVIDDLNLTSSGSPRMAVIDRLWDRDHQSGTFDKTRTKQVMSKVSLRLDPRLHSVTLRHRAEAKSYNLREDEPHPMTLLSAGRQFVEDARVNGVLSLHEAVEIEKWSLR